MRYRLFYTVLMVLLGNIVWGQQIVFTPQWTAQSQFAGYYAAFENGYYKEAGLDVCIKHPTSSYSSINMLKDSTSDIITCELIQAMMVIDDNFNLVNILQTTQHSTLVLVAKDNDVKGLEDLAGRRVGSWKVGFSEIPHMIDKKQNLNIEWIKLTNPLNLYISGAIDATLAKSYNEMILFSMSGITPGSVMYFSENGYDFPEDGLYVSEEYYKKNKEQCQAFAEASCKGWEWVRNNPDKAIDIVMKYIKEANVPSNRYNQKWMLEAILAAQEDTKGGKPSFGLNAEVFNNLNATLLDYGYIPKALDYEKFIGDNL